MMLFQDLLRTDPALRVKKHTPTRSWQTFKKVVTPWLVVFDLDGTLIDSSRDLCTSVNAALAHVNRPNLPEKTIESLIGDGAATLVRRALAVSEATSVDRDHEQLFQRCFAFFLEFYRAHKLDTTRLYPGVEESLRTIRQCHPGLLMAVLTNKPVKPSREICEALGIAPFFFANYGGDSFCKKKPAPDGLMAIIREAREDVDGDERQGALLQAAGVVMVGDSEADVLAGRACGAQTLGCRYGLAPDALQRARPDVLVDSAFDWPGALGL